MATKKRTGKGAPSGASTLAAVFEAIQTRAPRARLEMAHNTDYLQAREAVLEFLYHKQAHVEREAA